MPIDDPLDLIRDRPGLSISLNAVNMIPGTILGSAGYGTAAMLGELAGGAGAILLFGLEMHGA